MISSWLNYQCCNGLKKNGMRFIIVEDEHYAFKELKRMLQELYPESEVVAHFDSVSSAVNGLPEVKADLLFLDISLPDGFSFDILSKVELSIPIIFTTAYDEFALKAFKYNSIDYLLKPIESEDLKKAITKYQSLQKKYDWNSFKSIAEELKEKRRKKRFLIKIGDKYSYVQVEDIAYFYREDKTTYIKTKDNKSYITDYSLGVIEELVDENFFRISRHVICSLEAVDSVSKYFGSRLKIKLKPAFDESILISRVKVKEFLAWMDE
ncbi:response regulator transcription factor [Prolixibacteraceae bacterium JC049]|nr:response regulator transcription factor [Prolixibacteraceae bacterium JC049]